MQVAPSVPTSEQHRFINIPPDKGVPRVKCVRCSATYSVPSLESLAEVSVFKCDQTHPASDLSQVAFDQVVQQKKEDRMNAANPTQVEAQRSTNDANLISGVSAARDVGSTNSIHAGSNVSDSSAKALASTTLPTTGIKYDDGKSQHHLLDFYSVDQLSKVLSFGAGKYAPNNWRNGIKFSRLISSTLRHVFAFARGETYDRETGLHHMAHAMCNCMFLVAYNNPACPPEVTKDLDDRFTH